MRQGVEEDDSQIDGRNKRRRPTPPKGQKEPSRSARDGSKSPNSRHRKNGSKEKVVKYQPLEMDQNTNYASKNELLDTGESQLTIPYHAIIQESLLLSDNEVTISFMKFMIGIAILNFPAQSAQYGIFNGFMATAIICAFILKSNENLVKAIPLELMNQNLTLGEISGYIFGHKSYKNIVDLVIILCQGSNYILYLKYVGTQVNQIVCQETDGQLCKKDQYFMLYYYVPVSLVVLMLCQLRNYKQISYVAKLAMIATVIAIIAIFIDAIINIMVYFRVEYTETKSEEQLVVAFNQNNQS